MILKKRRFIMCLFTLITVLSISMMYAMPVGADDADTDEAPDTNIITLGSSSAWDVLFQHDMQTQSGEMGCLGIEFDGAFFWMTGGLSYPQNKLYKFDVNGNLIASYDQPTTSYWGWRDLAFDGTYLYASDESGFIEQIDRSTGAVTGIKIPGPLSPNRALAYDPATDHFWTADWSSEIFEIDRTGAIIHHYANTLSAYGFAWDSLTAEAPMLWVWSQDGASYCLASQFDPVNGVFTGVTHEGIVVDPGQAAGGACFMNLNGLGTFVGLHQSDPDSIVGYKIGPVRDFTIHQGVGGEVYSINKAGVIVPWMILAVVLTCGGFYLVRRKAKK
jgi:hypothetical protein